MSFNKLSYDNCQYKANLEANVSQLSYILDNNRFASCNKCFNNLGLVGGTAVSHVAGNLVDLESNLIGIDREASKCPSMKYIPNNDNAALGADYYRPVCTNVVDTTMKHLQPCQIYSTPHVPYPPPMQSFKCPNK
jgi:hypothetical protein